ncbi:hypothetical protein IU500_30160 [Nocardia terpenica]|uniref:Roadblock/LC7 domain-containing protein n=1 Tax=Nocardia terpenica TaxID=455432 RepID=A0A164MM73_9NOCA|nr:hypothetical protein [Nocardia terpenica]KZM73484.1 hypothetical protein AWN90_33190 [Nocardia terpenica]MBF6065683.1 hypothetical protein [Nocardia terpenica]MBF6108279.1 hypothetical protein [Nocardia terpenica]MBF6115798.1 hypothetical protein [Nocardia terpenica]MBF6122928.1 hypothetical protein [Nocardia terpenica]
MDLDEALRAGMSVDGAVGIALVDYDSGMVLGKQGGNALLDLEVAGAVNTEVVRAKMRAIEALQLDDAIEDILITLGGQYHIIRPLENRTPGARADSGKLFLYFVLDRSRANLALARHQLRRLEQAVSV